MNEPLRFDTPDGPGELVLDEADPPTSALLLGHGAGGDIDGWDQGLLASRLPAVGVGVARFRQPYRVAGRRIYSAKPGLDRGWSAALAEVRRLWPGVPLFTGGHSAGARTACRGADAGQLGLVLLSFPLHPPGKPELSRAAELVAVRLPVLVVQGSADAFGTPTEIRSSVGELAHLRLVELAGAGHSLGPTAKTGPAVAEERQATLVEAVAGFIEAWLRPPPVPAAHL